MSDRWKRWGGYMDELEDLLRWMAAEFDRAERDTALDFGVESWSRQQKRKRLPELARRMGDMPFFGELLRHNAGVDPADIPLPLDSGLQAHPTEAMDLNPIAVPGQAIRPPEPAATPPRRLVSAERALAARTRSLIPVLDSMTVPRNASAVIRTAEALGLQEMHFIHADGYLVPQRAVTKRSECWIDLHESRDATATLGALRARGYRLLGADFGSGSVPLEEVALTGPVAVVLGSEQEGLSDEVRGQVDEFFHIPTVGMTAYLNVSVAAAITLSTFDRRLRAAGLRSGLDEADRRAMRARWYRGLARGRARREGSLLRWLHRPPDPGAR